MCVYWVNPAIKNVMDRIKKKEALADDIKTSLISGIIYSFVGITITTLVYLWVDKSQNGFDIPTKYQENIEKCSGKELDENDIELQNYFSCALIILGFAAYSGFVFKETHPIPDYSDFMISLCQVLAAKVFALIIAVLPAGIFFFVFNLFKASLNPIVVMFFGGALPCFLGFFALFSGLRERIYFCIIRAPLAKKSAGEQILTALGPDERGKLNS